MRLRAPHYDIDAVWRAGPVKYIIDKCKCPLKLMNGPHLRYLQDDVASDVASDVAGKRRGK